MIHILRLDNKYFDLIKEGTKTIEIRLYDEKRRLININDKIEFINRETGEKLNTQVVNLHIYNSFEELYNKFDNISLGYSESEIKNPKDMEKYYSKEEQNKYGVIGIELKLI